MPVGLSVGSAVESSVGFSVELGGAVAVGSAVAVRSSVGLGVGPEAGSSVIVDTGVKVSTGVSVAFWLAGSEPGAAGTGVTDTEGVAEPVGAVGTAVAEGGGVPQANISANTAGTIMVKVARLDPSLMCPPPRRLGDI